MGSFGKIIVSLEGVPCDYGKARQAFTEVGFAFVTTIDDGHNIYKEWLLKDANCKKEVRDSNGMLHPFYGGIVFLEYKGEKRIVIPVNDSLQPMPFEKAQEAFEKYGMALVDDLSKAHLLLESAGIGQDPEWEKHVSCARLNAVMFWWQINTGVMGMGM